MGASPEVKRPQRVVLDTNVVVSALVFRHGPLASLRAAGAAAVLVPVVSGETLAELLRALAWPKLGLGTEQRKLAVTQYMEHAEIVTAPRTRARLPRCRDPNDEMFLRLAYAAKVDAIVTGDRDLLALAGESKIPIIRPAELADLTGARP
jgi:putative PIN family toxin of toxin-antitoxin system